MKKNMMLLLLVSLLLFACKNSSRSLKALPANETEPAATRTISPPPGLHTITLQQTEGFFISKAFLTNPQGNLLPRSNTVKPGDTVILHLAVQNGWRIKNGAVAPGASQTIVTDLGEPVLQSGDLFPPGKVVPAAEAANLRLQTVVTATRPDIHSYTVHFRVWDKNGHGEVKGSYRLNMEK